MMSENAQLQPTSAVRSLQARFALVAACISALMGGVLTVVAAPRDMLPVYATGEVGIAVLFIVATALTTLIVTALSYRRARAEEPAGGFLVRVIGRVAATAALTLLLIGAVTLLFYLLNNAFIGVAIERWFVALLVALFSGLLAWCVSMLAAVLTDTGLYVVAVLTLIVGVTLAMATSTNPAWWNESLSYLGAQEGSMRFFNVGLILGGLLLLCVAADLVADLRMLREQGALTANAFAVLRVALYGLGILLAGIGVFELEPDTWLWWAHQIVAHAFFAAMIALEIAVPLVIRGYPPYFRLASLGFAVASGAFFVLWTVVGAISFVTFQLILTAMSLGWFVFFLNETDRLARGAGARVFALTEAGQAWLAHALRTGLYSAAAAGLIALVETTTTASVPVIGEDETAFGALLITLSAAITVVVTAVSYRRFDERNAAAGTRVTRLLNRVVISVAMTLLVTFACFVIVYVLRNLFAGQTISASLNALLLTAIGFGVGTGVALFTSRITTFQVWVTMAAVTVFGLLWSATNTVSPIWWQNSVSFMSHDQGSATAFRITVMTAGFLWVVAAEDILLLYRGAVARGRMTRARFRWATFLMYGVGLCIVGIGIFPTVVSPLSDALHNFFAASFSVLFIALAYVPGWLAPFYPSWFKQASVVIGAAATAAIVIHYTTGWFNFVATQLLLFGMIGLWAVLHWIATQAAFPEVIGEQPAAG
jgi:hypothetical protein